MVKSMNEILNFAKSIEKKRVAVAVAQDEEVLQSVHEAHKLGLINVSLVGDKEKIYRIADELKIDVSIHDIIKELSETKAITHAIDLINSRNADILMKGKIKTSELLRGALIKDFGLRTNRILSHTGVFEVANYHKLLFITDAGVNIAPELKQKADIIQNAVYLANSLGIEKPKVAILAAIEDVNPNMQCTLDAAALSKMADRNQIRNCTVDGPLAMDNAINLEAVKHKGIESNVAGDADILLVPDIHAGNILVKALSFLYNAKSCGLILGARVPIITTSRADSYEAKLNSIALAVIACSRNN